MVPKNEDGTTVDRSTPAFCSPVFVSNDVSGWGDPGIGAILNVHSFPSDLHTGIGADALYSALALLQFCTEALPTPRPPMAGLPASRRS